MKLADKKQAQWYCEQENYNYSTISKLFSINNINIMLLDPKTSDRDKLRLNMLKLLMKEGQSALPITNVCNTKLGLYNAEDGKYRIINSQYSYDNCLYSICVDQGCHYINIAIDLIANIIDVEE